MERLMANVTTVGRACPAGTQRAAEKRPRSRPSARCHRPGQGPVPAPQPPTLFEELHRPPVAAVVPEAVHVSLRPERRFIEKVVPLASRRRRARTWGGAGHDCSPPNTRAPSGERQATPRSYGPSARSGCVASASLPPSRPTPDKGVPAAHFVFSFGGLSASRASSLRRTLFTTWTMSGGSPTLSMSRPLPRRSPAESIARSRALPTFASATWFARDPSERVKRNVRSRPVRHLLPEPPSRRRGGSSPAREGACAPCPGLSLALHREHLGEHVDRRVAPTSTSCVLHP